MLIIVALPIAIAVSIYAYLLPSQYKSETTVAFAPKPTANISGDVMKVVLPRYVALLQAPVTTEEVAAEVGASPQTLENADISIGLDTANLSITVQDTDPVRAARAANSLAAAVLEAAKDDRLLAAQQLAKALPPSDPSGPQRLLLSAAGLVAGVLVALALMALAERLRPRIGDAADAGEAAGSPVLGLVPTSVALARGRTTPATDPVVGSAMRSLLTRIERRGAEVSGGTQIVGFTAPSGGHGRTCLSSAYAAAASRRGRRVAWIHATLGSGRARDDLPWQRVSSADAEAPSPPELTSVIDGYAGVDECVIEGVSLLRARVDPDTALVGSTPFVTAVTKLLDHVDQVIVDCPGVSDDEAHTFMAQLPLLVLIVRAKTRAAEVADAAAQLDSSGASLVGVVLNRRGRARNVSSLHRAVRA